MNEKSLKLINENLSFIGEMLYFIAKGGYRADDISREHRCHRTEIEKIWKEDD